MLISILFLIFGLIVLIGGAEVLVRGSASLAKKLGISPLAIGLTVVAFGTSAPELIVNIFAALKGSTDIAIGNIVGSNIANIFLILGVSACIRSLAVKKSTVFKEIPFALLAMVLVFTMGNDAFFDGSSFNTITRTDGFSLIAMFAIFMVYVFGLSKMEGNNTEEIQEYSYLLSSGLTIFGLICLFFGGKILIDGAVDLARIAGLSEAFIGLTIVAVGTSLPELATSVIATIHKHDDIAIGNIVGSNIFNVFWILGLTSTMLQLPFTPAVNFDVTVGILATVLLFLFLLIGKRRTIISTQYIFSRWTGVLFLIFYIAYLIYLAIRG
ncbi:sodium:proton exchanger [Candidatus Peregrinibacteria bacterium RIFOXYB2_FULL_32_7]|nr:MAG: sodium:proton exchanger [Candidatus Peregrinibacteria bacterium RIFOXYB2_FULL_32_7]